MSTPEWFYRGDGWSSEITEGPLSDAGVTELIQSGTINDATLVNHPVATGGNWTQASQVPAIVAMFREIQERKAHKQQKEAADKLAFEAKAQEKERVRLEWWRKRTGCGHTPLVLFIAPFVVCGLWGHLSQKAPHPPWTTKARAEMTVAEQKFDYMRDLVDRSLLRYCDNAAEPIPILHGSDIKAGDFGRALELTRKSEVQDGVMLAYLDKQLVKVYGTTTKDRFDGQTYSFPEDVGFKVGTEKMNIAGERRTIATLTQVGIYFLIQARRLKSEVDAQNGPPPLPDGGKK